MKALISPNEQTFSYDGNVIGQRVADVVTQAFEVAEPLFWVDCPNDCERDTWYYLDGQILKKPEEPMPEPSIEEIPDEEIKF